MKYELINRSKTPPGGWMYVTEDKNRIAIDGMSLQDLTQNVVEYHKIQKNTVPPDIRDVIIQQICARSGPHHCKEMSEGLGDSVQKAAKVTGVAAVAKAIAKSRGRNTCAGCEKRRKVLNKLFPYGKGRVR